jgi:hypothetical protein
MRCRRIYCCRAWRIVSRPFIPYRSMAEMRHEDACPVRAVRVPFGQEEPLPSRGLRAWEGSEATFASGRRDRLVSAKPTWVGFFRRRYQPINRLLLGESTRLQVLSDPADMVSARVRFPIRSSYIQL